MTGQSKHHSHIWDNVLDSFGSNSHQNPPRRCHLGSPRDSTGSRMNLIEYERKRTTKVTTTATTHYDSSPNNEKNALLYVTDAQRSRAQQPLHLGAWTFVKDNSEKRYNKETAMHAFSEYGRRLKEKKKERQQPYADMIQVPPRKVLVHRDNSDKIRDASSRKRKEPKKDFYGYSRNVEITNQRDDDVKIESHHVRNVNDSSSSSRSADAPKYQSAFYGTIEAEKCASKAAEHILIASDNLKRLQFITEAVFPQSKDQMETLCMIGNDVKEFNAQLKTNRAKVPTNLNMNGNHVARFVLENN